MLDQILDWIVNFLGPYERPLRLLSYIFGPLVGAIGLYWGVRERKQLRQQAEDLGQLKQEVRQARTEVTDARTALEGKESEVALKQTAVARLQQELRGITEGAQQVWKLKPALPFDDYKSWLRDPLGAKIITIGNLKGGVGKTTLAVNLAAYISETLARPVLIVDLDYQGSLSNMLMLAAGQEVSESKVDTLLQEDAGLATLERAKTHLVPKLSRVWLVTASFSLAELENRLLLKWLIEEQSSLDVRYRLAKVLLDPVVRRSYGAIILDTPPRMTIGTVNALVASHHFLVPTTLDKLSAEAVPRFITNIKAIRADLDLDIELAGIVGTMSRQQNLGPTEQAAQDMAREGGYEWKANEDYILPHVARLTAIADAAGEDIAYFGKDSQGQPLRNRFDPIFESVCSRIGLTKSQ